MVLRAAQQKILQYRGGRLAVSAVPGSGKTFTLALLACELIRDGLVNVQAGQQILIVTYLNASVETFRARVRQRLEEFQLPLAGYEVRTLHSLALEIVRLGRGDSQSTGEELIVMDETQSIAMLTRATDAWIEANQDLWHALLADEQPQAQIRWRNLIESAARSFIREAKNHRCPPEAIWHEFQASGGRLNGSEVVSNFDTDTSLSLLFIVNGIYDRYQSILRRQDAIDFDDLIWQATELLMGRSDVAEAFAERWPFVLEDEAQDSVPLQETLLSRLTEPSGNWVRVGDPNQAITSTFTSAHPRHFNAFMALPDVVTLPLPNSGRCAPLIFGAANRLVEWVCDQHPVPEVRRYAFRRQQILPAPPGDAQPNPPDDEAALLIKVYRHREEDEAPAIAQLAAQYTRRNPEHTLAILTPTNDFGHTVADRLDGLDASYDNLLRGGTRVREIASALSWLLRLLANPLDRRALEKFHDWLLEFQHPMVHQDGGLDSERLPDLLRSVGRSELLLFAEDDDTRLSALPSGVATDEECSALVRYVRYVQRLFQYRSLAIDDMILSLSDELFTNEEGLQPDGGQADLAISYQLAAAVRQWWELQPDWRLPELADQLAEVAEGRRRLHNVGYDLSGYDPQPGRITLATQHGAKGMEWDAVFLAGIDGHWIPKDLESHFIGVEALIDADPAAEVSARLHYPMGSDGGLYPGRSPTESAHIEIICERLRLLYVGITRARRYLHISRSRRTTRRQRDILREPATIMGVLYHYLQSNTAEPSNDTSP